MQSNAGEVRASSYVTFSCGPLHTYEQVLNVRLEFIYNSSVQTQDIVKSTCYQKSPTDIFQYPSVAKKKGSSQVGLKNTSTAPLQRSKTPPTSVVDMTFNLQMMRRQSVEL